MAHLGDFFDTIFGPNTGFVRVARRSATSGIFEEHFFQWPGDKQIIIGTCVSSAPSFDVFYSPALFATNETSKKENVKGARVAWCDFDGNVPTELRDIPEPSIKLISSDADRQHWYWVLDDFQPPSEIESINRKLVAAFDADTVWDAGRLLRPPGTYNHKREQRTSLHHFGDRVYSTQQFASLPEPDYISFEDEALPETLPKFEDVIAFSLLLPSTWKLIKDGRPPGYRSEGLYHVAVKCAEVGLSSVDILTILLNCDNRWGKFKGRSDQKVRLWQIAQKAKAKYPDQGDIEAEEELYTITVRELIESDIEMDWAWQERLEQHGLMILTGQSGVGKTQFSLQAAYASLLGIDLLGKPAIPHGRLGFFSLEMGPLELKAFISQQLRKYDEEQRHTINENLILFPLGEPFYVDNSKNKERLKILIERYELAGIFVDSLGLFTSGSLSDEESMRNLMNWIALVRQNMGTFFWIIHHHRKGNDSKHRPNQLADVYGNHYITSLASSVACMWPAQNNPRAIEFSNLKLRMWERFAPIYIARNEHLHYDLASTAAEQHQVDVAYTEMKEAANQFGEGFGFGAAGRNSSSD